MSVQYVSTFGAPVPPDNDLHLFLDPQPQPQ